MTGSLAPNEDDELDDRLLEEFVPWSRQTGDASRRVYSD